MSPWHLAVFSNILLETFVPNLVFFTQPSLQILGKAQMGVFTISGFMVNPLKKEIVITTEPVMILALNLEQQLKLTTETKQRRKTLTMTSCRAIMTLLPFFQLKVNLEHSKSWIPDA